MNYRQLGKTGFQISEISLGTWQLGGRWGPVDDAEALAVMRRAVECGVNFLDTSVSYGQGRAERLIGRLLAERRERIYIATKCGRQVRPPDFGPANIRACIEESLRNLGVEALDLLQLHSPPSEVFDRPEIFTALDDLQKEGKILSYGASVDRLSDGLKAMQYSGLATIQVIFNMFRQRPVEELLPEARRRNVGVIARVPLASGLLTGKMSRETVFLADDHRLANRHGELFDVGETFAGVDFETGLAAVEELKEIFGHAGLAPYALRWILMHDGVGCVIPGAKSGAQIEQNVGAAGLAPLTEREMGRVREIYDRHIKPAVHNRW